MIDDRDIKANRLITTAIGVTAAAGMVDFTPGGIDVPIIIGAWGTMLGGMAVLYDAEFDLDLFARAATQALSSGGLFFLGTKTLTWLLKITGVGYFIGGGINAFLNAFFTWRVGIMYQRAFKDGGKFTADEIAKAMTSALVVSMSDIEAFQIWRGTAL